MHHLENRGAGEVEKKKKGVRAKGTASAKAWRRDGHHGAGRSLFQPEHRVSRRETLRSQPAQNPHTRLSMTLTLEAKGQQGHDKADLCLKRQLADWRVCHRRGP